MRIIQWSSGNVGKGVIRAIAESPGLELVGLRVFSDSKVGADAGEIAGIEALGVAASTDTAALLAMDADLVIHTALPSLIAGEDLNADVDLFCQLLASGKNVITTAGYIYPKIYGSDTVQRLEGACTEGGVSFHGTGLNPGWLGDVLPLTMSALSRRVDQVLVREITNFEFYPSPEIMFGMMGFGKTEAEFELSIGRYRHWLTSLFRENVQMIADGLGLAVDEIVEHTERCLTDKDLETAAGPVKAGTIAGQRWEWAAVRDGEKRVVHETVWRMHRDVAPDWPRGDNSVVIEGKPRMQINFAADWISDGLLATGMHALNSAPHVIAAPPGIRTPLNLPRVTGTVATA